jgi:hypothetical protein
MMGMMKQVNNQMSDPGHIGVCSGDMPCGKVPYPTLYVTNMRKEIDDVASVSTCRK